MIAALSDGDLAGPITTLGLESDPRGRSSAG